MTPAPGREVEPSSDGRGGQSCCYRKRGRELVGKTALVEGKYDESHTPDSQCERTEPVTCTARKGHANDPKGEGGPEEGYHWYEPSYPIEFNERPCLVREDGRILPIRGHIADTP